MKKVEKAKELEAAVAGRKAIVLFHATWCPVCRSYRPFFEKATKDGPHEVIEAVLDDEENPLWDDHGIEIVPSVFLYEDGQIVKRLYGRRGVGLSKQELLDALEAA